MPLIVPVVVYHGRSRREALRIRDLVTVPDDRCTIFVPDFEISFQDFSPEAETEIKGTIELRLLCSCLRAKNDPTSVLRVMEIFRLLHRLGDDACALQWVATIYRYLAGTMDIEAEVVHDIAQQTLSTNKRDTIMTLAERLHQQGLQEGRLEGKQNILQRLLAKRFGNSILGIGLQERLRSATPEELDTWTERILDASTIDDIFADETTD